VARSLKNVAVKTQQCILPIVVELHVTLNEIKILSVAQQCFHCKSISPTTMQIIRISFFKEITFQIICTLSTLYK